MNRYPLWKYVVMLVALVIGLVYTLPNFFGEAPAVQISSGKATVKLDSTTLANVESALAANNVKPDEVTFDNSQLNANIRVRLKDTDTQLRVKDLLSKSLNSDPTDPQFIVALNLQSASPRWLTALHALPMYLGLDLRGGVHFLMQVDMQAALTKKADSTAGDVRTILRDKNVRHAGITRDGNASVVRFRDQATLASARPILADQLTDFVWTESQDGADWKLSGSLKPDSIKRVQEAAIMQNITTLHNRVNELGVAEPVIQQQGADRVVVQLPGVQDTAKAKDIIGRTATLEMRMVDESSEGRMAMTGAGPVPFGSERYTERGGQPLIVKRQVLLTGENLTDAQPGFDGQTQEPAVHLTVDARGARIMRDVSRENIGKRMAILLFEKGKGEVVTAPVIRGELGNRFQISGRMTTAEANDVALLLRAGSLAAPMEIIEERTIGPSLGAENIDRASTASSGAFARSRSSCARTTCCSASSRRSRSVSTCCS